MQDGQAKFFWVVDIRLVLHILNLFFCPAEPRHGASVLIFAELFYADLVTQVCCVSMLAVMLIVSVRDVAVEVVCQI